MQVQSMEGVAMSRSVSSAEIITLHGVKIKETEKAVLFKFCIDPEEGGDGEDHSEWFPLSQVSKMTTHPSEPDTLTVSRWLMEKKGLLS